MLWLVEQPEPAPLGVSHTAAARPAASTPWEVPQGHGIGASFFNGKSAGHVCGMSRAELDDVIDSWTEVPIIAKVAISVDPETDQIKMFPYQMRRLPMSHMP